MNSRTSRPRSPTRQITLTSADVERAIMPSSDDLPTPEPAKMPRRWPRPHGTSASSARTPSDTRSAMRGRSSGSGGAACAGRARRRPASGPAPSIGRPRPSSARPEQLVGDVDAQRPAGGGHARARADARGVAERHQQRAAGAEADDLGGHGGAPAAGLDRADLADLGLEAGGLDDQADQVAHAAVAAVQVGVAEGGGGPVQRDRGSRARPAQRGLDDLARALELRLDAGVDVAVGRAHDGAAAADAPLGLDLAVLDAAERGQQPVHRVAHDARGRRG